MASRAETSVVHSLGYLGEYTEKKLQMQVLVNLFIYCSILYCLFDKLFKICKTVNLDNMIINIVLYITQVTLGIQHFLLFYYD